MFFKTLVSWFDNQAVDTTDENPEKIECLRVLPFIVLHLACFAVFWVEFSTIAISVAALLYLLRMFAITGFYHRYFAHKAFKTSRAVQFIFAFLAASAAQRGPLWWASHHRHHHAHSDHPEDPHSPKQHGFFWSHLSWFLANKNFRSKNERIKDWLKYPELTLLDRYDVVAPMALALGLFGLGAWLENAAPYLQTNGMQLFIWGFVISTVLLYHMTFTVNSLAHVWGKRRFLTNDDSRNNPVIALFTLGEGWHNNHHHFPSSARQGFYWWEIDLTYYGLKILSALGLIWDLRKVPVEVLSQKRTSK
ncbi:MAG: acyl-CoA desaturase [Sulfuritalea sp.]|jgi:stearoyl-CoA desaturase (delta-9 desaturase)|nr:acyl-CoA desaturase [Sulfuritalea sp.]